MIPQIKSKIEELKKGCKKRCNVDGEEEAEDVIIPYTRCGNVSQRGLSLCNLCKSKLQTWKEALNLVEDAKKKLENITYEHPSCKSFGLKLCKPFTYIFPEELKSELFGRAK